MPAFKPSFVNKIAKLKTRVHDARTRLDSRVNSSTTTPEKNVRRRFLALNLEVEMKHDFAQQVIEIINENERVLLSADSKLSSFLDHAYHQKAHSTLAMLENLQTDWRLRIKNLATIFDFISARRRPSVPQNLLETILKTPKSLARTTNFDTPNHF